MFNFSALVSRLRHSPVQGLAFAISAYAIALFVRLWAATALPDGFPYVTFFPAVILTTLVAGLWPGVVCGALSGVTAWYLFIPPERSFALDVGSAVALTFFMVVVAVDIIVIHVMNTALERLDHERRRSAELTRQAQVMFSELQHRVSNNLQLVSSLLTLQQSKVRDPEALRAMEDARQRVATLGRLHRALHDPERQKVDIGGYLRDLCRDVIETSGAAQVSCAVEAEPVALGPEKLLPLALVVCELVSNSLEHGFPEGRAGTVSVALRRHDDEVHLQVRDDGAGLPEHFELERQDSLGLQIVRALAGQLGGRFSMHRDKGTVATLAFSPSDNRRAA